MWHDDPTNPERNLAETDFLNRWILRYPFRVPLFAAVLGAALLVGASFLHAWRLFASGILVLLVAAFLLVYGLARKLPEMTSVRLVCPNCGSGFIVPRRSVPADHPLKCPNCGSGDLAPP